MDKIFTKKLVIMAGGTGGHVFPGLAVAQVLINKGWKLDWIGTADRMEADIVPANNIPIHFIKIAGIRGKGLARKVFAPFHLIKAFFQARKILQALAPDAVLGMGGYASGPGGLAAWSLNIPLVVHEQNAVFGLTNKLLAKFAKRVLTGFSFDDSSKHNSIFVGNPIRANFAEIPAMESKPLDKIRLSEKNDLRVNILIIGGSLGALALNQIVPRCLLGLSEHYAVSIHHQSGKNKLEQVNQAYANAPNVKTSEFIDDMPAAFAWSDIVICRAGALTVAEVAASGRAAIFVPLPIAVDDHQTKNAQSLSKQGAAIIIPQDKLTEVLPRHLTSLLEDENLRLDMASKAKKCLPLNASNIVVEHIEQAAQLDAIASQVISSKGD
ncbi:undecaprenyldiphospho-muramoylpentapeptide beta-N-acetylglucosaminyltransferase [Glaciecola petra]|uniref:UDP-N-acetylglucosamine--N-acetylmuramyl-(pentapeptide) pyrophosphoryl-undecaprenol N-acetylglucosamine transferase n=1 Tax=Glaciecola petra TaxID=3075602 RepID=A0ABU2ZMB6_9ALTE|nr:undecaprenyldiphospho-muramoylpentapeptide beta-N-acetylglucosaminyltransferase [Aestuariibacter sp. P117]MDT0593499.1 undecaprenyldiphospho-muramoylpentapeptide beta-N-acetylglucosaminyltransferase [Aestuariibacter sp. P117]